MAAGLFQGQLLFFRLDAFGDRVFVEGVGQCDDGTNDGPVFRFVGHAVDEVLVDLDGVGGQPFQIAQRGVARSEVVDGDTHADALEGAEHLDAGLGIEHRGAFGDFQFQAGRRQVAAADDGRDLAQQVRILELTRGEIDCHAQIESLVEPCLGLRAGGFQYPFPQRQDEPRLLGDRNELGGMVLDAVGIAPAQQGFGAEDPARFQVDDRLVVEPELLFDQRVAHFRFERQPLLQPFAQPRFKAGKAAAAQALRLVHGRVGVLEQCLAVGAVVREEGQADAAGHFQSMLGHLERRLEHHDQALRRPGGGGGRAVGKNDQELVAAQARQHVVMTQRGGRPFADFGQELVADAVPERVVDVLEAIEIEKHDRERSAAFLGGPYLVLQKLFRACAVGEPRQRIAPGLAQEFVAVLPLVNPDPVGNGAEDGHEDQEYAENRTVVFPPFVPDMAVGNRHIGVHGQRGKVAVGAQPLLFRVHPGRKAGEIAMTQAGLRVDRLDERAVQGSAVDFVGVVHGPAGLLEPVLAQDADQAVRRQRQVAQEMHARSQGNGCLDHEQRPPLFVPHGVAEREAPLTDDLAVFGAADRIQPGVVQCRLEGSHVIRRVPVIRQRGARWQGRIDQHPAAGIDDRHGADLGIAFLEFFQGGTSSLGVVDHIDLLQQLAERVEAMAQVVEESLGCRRQKSGKDGQILPFIRLLPVPADHAERHEAKQP